MINIVTNEQLMILDAWSVSLFGRTYYEKLNEMMAVDLVDARMLWDCRQADKRAESATPVAEVV